MRTINQRGIPKSDRSDADADVYADANADADENADEKVTGIEHTFHYQFNI